MCLKGLLNHVFQRLDFLTQRATFRIIFRKNSWHIFIENSVAFWHFLSKYFDTIHPPPNCIPAIESERRNQNDFLIKKLCISLQERKKLWYANKNKMNFHVKSQCLVLQLIFVPATNLKPCLLRDHPFTTSANFHDFYTPTAFQQNAYDHEGDFLSLCTVTFWPSAHGDTPPP